MAVRKRRQAIRQREGTPALGGAARDLTRYVDAEERLARSEEQYRLLVTSSLDGVMLTAPDGSILSANAAACRMLGASEEDIRRLGRQGVVDTSDSRLAAALEERARTGRFHGELTMVRQDGTRFPAEVSTAVFQDRDGRMLTSTVIRDVSARRRIEAVLQHSRDEMRALAARLQEVREAERSRIAREIHDVLAQDLTRVKIDLVWLLGRLNRGVEPESVPVLAARVSEMCRITDGTIRSVQRIATDLRPAVLDSLGLCAAVEWQVRDVEARSGLVCHAAVPPGELAVGKEVATAVFRILQESLTNVLRHANATALDVCLRREAGLVILRVRDNGGGIAAEALTSPFSVGLTGMRERAALLGGKLDISSQPAAGTTIEVRIPFGASDREEHAQ